MKLPNSVLRLLGWESKTADKPDTRPHAWMENSLGADSGWAQEYMYIEVHGGKILGAVTIGKRKADHWMAWFLGRLCGEYLTLEAAKDCVEKRAKSRW